MKIPGLLPSQVADLGRAIVEARCHPTEFASEEISGEWQGIDPAAGLRHVPSSGFFAIGNAFRSYGYSDHLEEVGFRVGFKPGGEQIVEDRNRISWAEVQDAFRDWLRYLRREATTPDYWSAIADIGADANSDADLNDDPDASRPFTPSEQSAIEERLRGIEELLTTIAREQQTNHAFITREFAELRAELAKMNRGKWRKFAMGTLANIAMREIIPPSTISKAVDAARDFLTTHVGPRLLP